MSGQSLFYHSWVSENRWFPTASSPSARRLWRTLGAALGGWGSIAQRLQSDGPMEGSAVKQEVNGWGFSAWLSRGACFLNQFTLSHIPISWLISTWSGSPLLALCCSIFLIRGKYWTFLVYCYWKTRRCSESARELVIPPQLSMNHSSCSGAVVIWEHQGLQRQGAVPAQRSAHTISLKTRYWSMWRVLT